MTPQSCPSRRKESWAFSLLTHQSLVKGVIAGGEVGTGISALLPWGRNNSSSWRAIVQTQSQVQTFQSQNRAGRGTLRNRERDPGGSGWSSGRAHCGGRQEESVQREGIFVQADLNWRHSGQRVWSMPHISCHVGGCQRSQPTLSPVWWWPNSCFGPSLGPVIRFLYSSLELNNSNLVRHEDS